MEKVVIIMISSFGGMMSHATFWCKVRRCELMLKYLDEYCDVFIFCF